VRAGGYRVPGRAFHQQYSHSRVESPLAPAPPTELRQATDDSTIATSSSLH